MKSSPSQVSKQIGGVSANKIVLPIVAAVAVLHVTIVMLIFMISSASSNMSMIMQRSGEYITDATSLQAGSSLLSETSSNYVLLPTTEQGEPNLDPLMAYAAELKVERRGDQVAERFQGYEVSQEALDYITVAAESAKNMMTAQLHALALMNAAYPLPEIPALKTIPAYELTAEEQALSADEQAAAARLLVLGTEYAGNKASVSRNVASCIATLQGESARKAAETGPRIGLLRALLWGVTVSIILLLVATFAVLYRQLLFPLDSFARLITSDNTLDERKGLHEVRLVASAYNGLLKRRDALDAILRSAAETDALTNLPNRYRFEQYLLESGESGYSVAVILFDLNYLKITNDRLGHLAGDKLIRSAAECIDECFGGKDSSCFRFGGDEFAAVVKNIWLADVRRMAEQFEQAQKRRGISIAYGYAYTAEIGDTTYKKLMDYADKQMYARKEAMHRQALQNGAPSQVPT